MAIWLLVGVVMAAGNGCMRRRMTVRSNPPGARVFVDKQEIGVTPASASFTYYGTREIQLVKDGFETLTVQENFQAPWYEYPPLDFVTENLWPTETRDERVLEFQLIPQQKVPQELILERAQQLRANAWQGQAIPIQP